MSNSQQKSQGLLFSEPAYSDTGVWCELNQGIDPAEWARVCRHIGQMAAEEFEELSMVLCGAEDDKPSLWDKLKAVFSLNIENNTGFPLVSLGQGKPGDQGQWEV
jgi:hypothetical protein